MSPASLGTSTEVTLFLCGDVMTGRGIDQILENPSEPTLHESYMKDARGYVSLAERDGTVIPRSAGDRYIWGEALHILEQHEPDLRIINLETAVTICNEYWPGKGIHYRMNPRNVGCLTAAGIDCCTLANNHVIDWGFTGLQETLDTLHQAAIQTAGTGHNLDCARRPAIFEFPSGGRVLVFSLGSHSSGIPAAWEAKEEHCGVLLIDESSAASLAEVREQIMKFREPDDLVIVSIHWGNNWGYQIPQEQQWFAHGLIDDCGVDIIHGHSSHHVKGIEVYQERPILYGCGDFLTDYEGIRGHEEFRGDLGLMYFVTMDSSTRSLLDCRVVPTMMKGFQVRRATPEGVDWLRTVLNREGRKLGMRVELLKDHEFQLCWR